MISWELGVAAVALVVVAIIGGLVYLTSKERHCPTMPDDYDEPGR